MAAAWSISRSKSFERLAKLVEKDLVYPAGPTGSYRVTAKSPETQEPSPETQEPSPETKKEPSPETKKPQKTAKIHKTTRKESRVPKLKRRVPKLKKRRVPKLKRRVPKLKKSRVPKLKRRVPKLNRRGERRSRFTSRATPKSLLCFGETRNLSRTRSEKKVSVADGTASCEAGRVGSSA